MCLGIQTEQVYILNMYPNSFCLHLSRRKVVCLECGILISVTYIFGSGLATPLFDGLSHAFVCPNVNSSGAERSARCSDWIIINGRGGALRPFELKHCRVYVATSL